jgi:hypothetical protein
MNRYLQYLFATATARAITICVVEIDFLVTANPIISAIYRDIAQSMSNFSTERPGRRLSDYCIDSRRIDSDR